MKKLLGIVVFILFWCNVGFADLKVLNKYFNGKEETKESRIGNQTNFFSYRIQLFLKTYNTDSM